VYGTDVTRLLCRTIDLEMPKPDGGIAELSVIRPLWWLQGTGAAVGGSIDIGLHEIGLSGEATVLAIGPCDVDSRETRPGMSIVTGTIRHRNATVWDLTFDDRTEETLGVTANHPLYSETRHAWIPAGDLQLDEVVRTLNGHSTLTARTQRPTRETVFNLEVHRSHAYHVSAIGVLAHNTGLPCPVTTGNSPSRYPKPDPPMTEAPVRYEPKSIEEVARMRRGLGPTTKAAEGRKNIEAHHRNQVPVREGGIIDELEMEIHRGAGNHGRHDLPSRLTPAQRAAEIRDHWLKRGAEYLLPGEGI
jgi:hypothetical protein